MRTRPGCQEASSEPRWCRRCSLPASGLRGLVGAGGSEVMLRSAGPTALGSHSPLGPTFHRLPPNLGTGAGLLLSQVVASLAFGRQTGLRPPLLSKLSPWADSVYPKDKCLMEKGKGQGQAPWGSAEEDTAPATLQLGFACRAGLWAGLGYPFCAT